MIIPMESIVYKGSGFTPRFDPCFFHINFSMIEAPTIEVLGIFGPTNGDQAKLM